VHQDGLVHVSQLADRYVADANQVVRVGQKVRVTVQSVDLARGRIALTMKREGGERRAAPGATTAARPKAKGPGQAPEKAPGKAPAKAPGVPAFVPRSGAVAPNGIRFR
jgi:uncharacterized protein